MTKQFSVTYRDKNNKPLFVVTWNPYDFNIFKSNDSKKKDENDGIFWEAYFSFPCFDFTNYPEINSVVEDIYEQLHNSHMPKDSMNKLGEVVMNIAALEQKYIPDFLIKNNEIDWRTISLLTQNTDLPDMWDKLILKLESKLPRPIVLKNDNHGYIFHNSCSILEQYIEDGVFNLKELPNTCKLVFNEVGIENHNILLDIYSKTDAYYAVCSPEGNIQSYAIFDENKNVKALCLVP